MRFKKLQVKYSFKVNSENIQQWINYISTDVAICGISLIVMIDWIRLRSSETKQRVYRIHKKVLSKKHLSAHLPNDWKGFDNWIAALENPRYVLRAWAGLLEAEPAQLLRSHRPIAEIQGKRKYAFYWFLLAWSFDLCSNFCSWIFQYTWWIRSGRKIQPILHTWSDILI